MGSVTTTDRTHRQLQTSSSWPPQRRASVQPSQGLSPTIHQRLRKPFHHRPQAGDRGIEANTYVNYLRSTQIHHVWSSSATCVVRTNRLRRPKARSLCVWENRDSSMASTEYPVVGREGCTCRPDEMVLRVSELRIRPHIVSALRLMSGPKEKPSHGTYHWSEWQDREEFVVAKARSRVSNHGRVFAAKYPNRSVRVMLSITQRQLNWINGHYKAEDSGSTRDSSAGKDKNK